MTGGQNVNADLRFAWQRQVLVVALSEQTSDRQRTGLETGRSALMLSHQPIDICLPWLLVLNSTIAT